MPDGKERRARGAKKAAAKSERSIAREVRAKSHELVRLTDEQRDAVAVAMFARAGLDYRDVDGYCRGVLPHVPLETARRYVGAIALVAAGSYWRDVLAATGLSYAEMSGYAAHVKEYGELFKVAKRMQAEASAAKGWDALVEIATEGEERSVVAGGEVVAHDRTRPVKAIEMLLKAGDERFADGGGRGGGAISANGVAYVLPVLPVLTGDAVKAESDRVGGVVDAEDVEDMAQKPVAALDDLMLDGEDEDVGGDDGAEGEP